MVLKAFNEPLSVDYFADGQRLGTRGKGRAEKRRNSLVDLLNDLREKVLFGGYQVDPDDPDRYSTIDEAYAAADLILPAGESIIIQLVAGKKHSIGSLQFVNSRHVFIYVTDSAGIDGVSTIIEGDIDTVAAGAPNAMQAVFIGLQIGDGSGNTIITPRAGWNFTFSDCTMNNVDLKPTHGTHGVQIRMVNCDGGVSAPVTYADQDAAGSGFKLILLRTRLTIYAVGTAPFSFNGGQYNFIDSRLMVTGSSGAIFDFNNSAARINFWDTNIGITQNGSFNIVENAASGRIDLYNANTIYYDWFITGILGHGAIGIATEGWHLKLGNSITETDWPIGTLWEDQGLKDVLVWDGTYWGNGTIFRKDLLVDVGSAAVSHTSGWAVPAGAGVLNTSSNALKDLTSGGGATLYGISDGSDGDKFAESAALIKNSKAGAKQASINVGGGDTIYVHSMTSTGTEGGTLAGSNDEDVRVAVYFMMPKTLPSV